MGARGDPIVGNDALVHRTAVHPEGAHVDGVVLPQAIVLGGESRHRLARAKSLTADLGVVNTKPHHAGVGHGLQADAGDPHEHGVVDDRVFAVGGVHRDHPVAVVGDHEILVFRPSMLLHVDAQPVRSLTHRSHDRRFRADRHAKRVAGSGNTLLWTDGSGTRGDNGERQRQWGDHAQTYGPGPWTVSGPGTVAGSGG